MFEFLFVILALISTAGIILVGVSYKDLFGIGVSALLALLAIIAITFNLQSLLLAFVFLFILAFLLAFYKKGSTITLASICMMSAIVLAFFGIQNITGLDNSILFWVAILLAALISALGILGIFEENIIRFLVISNAIQLSFVALDLSVVKLFGKMGVLTTIQIFNYVFAGTLLFTALCVLTDNLKRGRFGEIYAYKASPIIAITASIAALSLAGIPALNIFVAEWYLFITAYSINPMITILSVFAALVLFIMYFKTVFALFVSKREEKVKKTKTAIIPMAVNIILAIICVLFGVFPNLQLMLLGV